MSIRDASEASIEPSLFTSAAKNVAELKEGALPVERFEYSTSTNVASEASILPSLLGSPNSGGFVTGATVVAGTVEVTGFVVETGVFVEEVYGITVSVGSSVVVTGFVDVAEALVVVIAGFVAGAVGAFVVVVAGLVVVAAGFVVVVVTAGFVVVVTGVSSISELMNTIPTGLVQLSVDFSPLGVVWLRSAEMIFSPA